jgi:hypothetical protein
VPDSVAVPFPLSVKLSPAGSVPLCAIVVAPVAVMVKLPAVPAARDASPALVKTGG